MYTTPAATAFFNGAVFDCVLSGLVTSSTATLTVTGAPSPSTSTVAEQALTLRLSIPTQPRSSHDPKIRICAGGPASGGADIGVTKIDILGEPSIARDVFSFIGVPLNGGRSGPVRVLRIQMDRTQGFGQIYFAVVHAKGSGTTVKAKLKFAVVR